jgi:hypothetical protein
MTLGTPFPLPDERQIAGVAASSPVAAIYHRRCGQFAAERDHVLTRWNQLANVRLIVAVIVVACLAWGIASGVPLLIIAGFLLGISFAALAVYHGTLGRTWRRAADLWAINDEAAKRLTRDWTALPVRHAMRAEPGHPYAVDLDIFGRASLYHLLDSSRTRIGEQTLGRWLLAPATPETVHYRQEAVGELAPLLDLRDELTLAARRLGASQPDPEPFLAWAESTPSLLGRPLLLWSARLSPLLLWLLLLAQMGDVIAAPWWLGVAVINIVLWMALGRGVHGLVSRLWQQEEAFRAYSALFELIGDAPFRSPALKRLQADLHVGGVNAARQMRRLHRIVAMQIPRSGFLYWPVQALTLWDVHVLWGMERWQASAGGHVRTWLTALGEVEALAALAGLSHDNPDWAVPEIDEPARTLRARGLGHPLLPPDLRVDNDVEVGPPGTFLLVTGSNMSGKSTLLRAIGVNLVLAGAGGPVCASFFRAPPVTLWTSMRIQDSLERGVSYFLAEVHRLKEIVDAARRTAAVGERRFFYLLDELLQGTNTHERQIAARRIITFLLAEGAIGAVSTHDLTLTDTERLSSASRPIYFKETILDGAAGPSMTFDYIARPGLATSTNALKLMEIVGLEMGAAPS